MSIFRTDDPGVLPLATMALEAEGIEYAVRNAGKADSLQWQMSQPPTNRPVVLEIVVAGDTAAKARDLVVDSRALRLRFRVARAGRTARPGRTGDDPP